MSVCPWVPHRYVIAALCYLALMVAYILRFCIAIIISSLVQPCLKNDATNYDCPFDQDTDDCTDPMAKQEFNWDERTQGTIMSSFFWGYVVMHVPGGLLADRLGGKYPLAIAVLVSAVCTLLTPMVTKSCGHWGLVVIRIVMGLGQGMLYPAVTSILSRWITANERTLVGGIVFSGAFFGNILAMLISGVILRQEGMWPMIFYLFGGLSLFWLAVWIVVGRSCPELVSGESGQLDDRISTTSSHNLPLTQWVVRFPWKSVLTSRPVWGLVVAELGHDWAMFTLVMELPKYLDVILHYSIWQTGIWTAMPNLALAVVSVLSGWLGQSLIRKRKVPVTLLRKIFATISSLGPAIGLIGATYSGCNKGVVNIFTITGMGLMGAYYSSLKVNCLDLSPNYAGTVMGLVNGLGAISGILTPYLASYLFCRENTMEQWRYVFLTAAVVLFITNAIYIILASAEEQSWNYPPSLISSTHASESLPNARYQNVTGKPS